MLTEAAVGPAVWRADQLGDPEQWISRVGLSQRVVSPEFQFVREDYFGLTLAVPELRVR